MARIRPRKSQSPTGERCCDPECCGATAACCGLPAPGCCRVEAVVGIDSRGQMVLPKDLREKLGLRPEDKLAVVSWDQGARTCCLTLHRADELAESVRQAYGPMLREIIRP